ncbi:MAG: hypothetical protein EOM72_00925 [Opitutae bacterium]|nr:hypothetical protein [Opitutae bacterium]
MNRPEMRGARSAQVKMALFRKTLGFAGEGWFWLLVALAFAMAWKWLALAAAAPHGGLSLLRFSAITVALFAGPGLFLLKMFPMPDSSPLTRFLWVVWISLGANLLVLWALYWFGIYTGTAAWSVLGISGLLGMAGASGAHPLSAALAFRRWWFRQPRLDRIVFAILALDLAFSMLQAAGTHFGAWDAIVSWDKWGCDMAERTGLGRYAMGGYPQMLPTLYSPYYKVAGTWLAGLPDEQLLLHGLNALFPLLLLAGLIRLCAVLRVRWSLAALVLFGNEHVRLCLTSGYADIPATALTIGGLALMLTAAVDPWPASWTGRRPVIGLLFSLPVFLMAFSKAQGVVFALLGLACGVWLAPRSRRWPVAAWLGCAVALGLLWTAPFYVHQSYYSRHYDEADANPRLHTFVVEVSKPNLIQPSWRKAGSDAKTLVEGYRQLPFLRRVDARIWWLAFYGGALAAVAIPRLVPIALMAGMGFVLWFFTVSYDWRNAFVPLALLSVLLAGSLTWMNERLKNHPWIDGLTTLSVYLLFGLGFSWGTIQNASRWGQAVQAPRIWKTELAGRLNLVSPAFRVVRNLVEQSPLGRRANRIYCDDNLYRYLGSRGVYTLKGNSFSDIKNHDLLLRKGDEPLPGEFTSVARLHSLGYDTLAAAGPCWVPTPFDVVAHGEVGLRPDGEGGFFLAGLGDADLSLAALGPLQGQSVVLLNIEFGSESEAHAVEVSWAPDWDVATVLRTRLLFLVKGRCAQGVIWLDRLGEEETLENPFPIHIRKNAPEQICIRKVGVEIIPPFVEAQAQNPGNKSEPE